MHRRASNFHPFFPSLSPPLVGLKALTTVTEIESDAQTRRRRQILPVLKRAFRSLSRKPRVAGLLGDEDDDDDGDGDITKLGDPRRRSGKPG